jgi:aminopeptidase N
MLRHVIGDDKFFAGIRDYYRTYRDRNALTADLQRAMEAQAGKSLDWFFKEWIFQPGYPVFDVTWTWNDGSRELAVRVVQTQTADPFQMPLELEIESSGHPRREILQVKDRDEVFKLNLDSKPSRIAIDPDEWVLKSLTIKEAG